MKKKYRKVGVWTNSPLKNMNKNEVFQFVNKLNNLDISTMIFRETVFDIISFGKANKIHLATTASIERIKHVLSEYNLEIAPDEKDTESNRLAAYMLCHDILTKEVGLDHDSANLILNKRLGTLKVGDSTDGEKAE